MVLDIAANIKTEVAWRDKLRVGALRTPQFDRIAVIDYQGAWCFVII
jgi:hypothetical protein